MCSMSNVIAGALFRESRRETNDAISSSVAASPASAVRSRRRYDEYPTLVENVFRYAVWRSNQEPRTRKLVYDIQYVSANDSYRATRKG